LTADFELYSASGPFVVLFADCGAGDDDSALGAI